MKELMTVLIAACGLLSARCGVYDDCQYLFRGGYNYSKPSQFCEASVQESEAPNALTLGYGVANASNQILIAGSRNLLVHETTDVTVPLTGRVLRNRSVLHLLQPTYTNPGSDTLYGYGTTYYFYSPFDSDCANAYTVHIRYKHDGKITPESTESILFDFGFGYSANTGLWLSLRGDDDNQYLQLSNGNGYGNKEFKGTQNAVTTRLSAGKWTDLLITREPVNKSGAMKIYTCCEGGQLCEQNAWTLTGSSGAGLREFYISRNYASSWHVVDTNTPATEIARFFRGSIAQIALWPRKLTTEEVKEVFASGYETDDLVRLGVDNDRAMEFTARDEKTQTDVTETDADQATDWRYFNASLTSDNPTATIRFSLTADQLLDRTRRLVLKATGDSCAGATVAAAVNGTSLGAAVSLAAGATVTIPVPWSLFRLCDNVLTVSRTDEGVGTLKIDSLRLGESELVTDDPQSVAGDVYSDAYGWWRHAVDANGDSKFNDHDYPNARLAKSSLTNDPTQVWTIEANAIDYQLNSNVTVTWPATAETCANESCVYFRNYDWGSGSGYGTHYGAIRQKVFAVTNAGNYAVMARMKIDTVMNGKSADLFGLGYSSSGNSGFGIILVTNTVDGVANLAVDLRVGNKAILCTGTQTGDERDRIGVGKWIDYAVSVSNGYMRLYTYVEGGTGLIEQNVGDFSGCAVSSSSASLLRLGMGVGAGHKDSYYGKTPAFKGWLHASALWPRALSRDEVLRAMQWPRPDIVRLGVMDKTANEFADESVGSFTAQANGDFAAASPRIVCAGGDYTVTFDLPQDQRGRNQLLRLSATDWDADFAIGVRVNGLVVTNFSTTGVAKCRFTPDADGLYTAGIRREWLKDGQNTVTVFADDDATGRLRIDALVIGNGGKGVPVSAGGGTLILVR